MGYREIILADNPYVYWRLGGESTMVDETGTFNGVYVGSPSTVPGALPNDPNTARSFPTPGTQYGNYNPPTHGPYMYGLGYARVICVEAWIRSILPDDQVTDKNFIFGTQIPWWWRSVYLLMNSNRYSSNPPGTKGMIGMGRMSANGSASLSFNNTTAFPNLNDQQWHHIVCVMDLDNSSNCRMYFDGTSAAITIAKTGTVPQEPFEQSVTVARMSALYYNGKADIDEVAVYIDDAAAAFINSNKAAAHYAARNVAPVSSREMPRGITRGLWP